MSTYLCPKCGSDELGENRLVTECRDIHSGEVLSRWDNGDWDRPRYTCECGNQFNDPKTIGPTEEHDFSDRA